MNDAAVTDAPMSTTPGDASEAGATLGDASESTAPIVVGTGAPSAISGAASADGSAMLILEGGAQSTEPAILNFSHYEPATGWSTIAALPGGTQPEDPPAIGMDAAGNTYVAWIGVTAPPSLSVMRYDHASQTWGAVQHPDPYTQALALGLAVAVNAAGDAFVLDFHAGTTGTHDAYVQHYTPGSPAGTWTQELVLSEPNGTGVGGAASYLAVSDTGNAVAAFSLGGTAAYTAATRSGTRWTQTPQANFSVNQIAVSINDAGDVLIGYEDQGTAPNAYQYDATSMTWSAMATKLNTETESSRNASCPLAVNVESTGDATLVRCFSGTSGSPQKLESYAFTKGTKAWDAATAIPVTGYSFFGGFVFDSAGSGLAAFGDSATNSTSTASVVTSSYEPATGWSAQSAPLGAIPTGVPHPFISPNGRGWVAWVDNQTTFKVEKVR